MIESIKEEEVSALVNKEKRLISEYADLDARIEKTITEDFLKKRNLTLEDFATEDGEAIVADIKFLISSAFGRIMTGIVLAIILSAMGLWIVVIIGLGFIAWKFLAKYTKEVVCSLIFIGICTYPLIKYNVSNTTFALALVAATFIAFFVVRGIKIAQMEEMVKQINDTEEKMIQAHRAIIDIVYEPVVALAHQRGMVEPTKLNEYEIPYLPSYHIDEILDRETKNGNFEAITLQSEDILYKSKRPSSFANIKTTTLEID